MPQSNLTNNDKVTEMYLHGDEGKSFIMFTNTIQRIFVHEGTLMGSTMLKLCTMVHVSNHGHISNITLQIHDLSNFLSSKLRLQNVKNTDPQYFKRQSLTGK